MAWTLSGMCSLHRYHIDPSDKINIYYVGTNDVLGIEKDDIVIFDKDFSLRLIERNYRLTLYTVVPLFFILTVFYIICFIIKIRKKNRMLKNLMKKIKTVLILLQKIARLNKWKKRFT